MLRLRSPRPKDCALRTRKLAAHPAWVALCSLFASTALGHDTDQESEPFSAHAVVSRLEQDALSTVHVHQSDLVSVPLRTAEDALRLVPGLTLVQHGSEGKGMQFFLRGFDAMHGADLELTLDDIPLNEWSNIHAQGYLDVAFIPPELIETVEVVKGPFELDQGAFAMAGSARYRLGVAPDALGSRASFSVGTTGRTRLFVGYAPRESDGSQFIAAEIVNDPGYGERRATRRASAMGKLHLLDSKAHGRLSLFVSAYAAEFELPSLLPASDIEAGRRNFYAASFPHGEGQSVRALGSLQYQLERVSHTLRATLYAGYRTLDLFENFTGYLYDPVAGDARLQRQAGTLFGGSAHFQAPLTEDLMLQASAGFRGDAFDQREQHADVDRVPLETRRELEAVQGIAHATLGINYRPIQRVTLEAGTRLSVVHVRPNHETTKSLVAASPRAIASFQAHKTLKLSLAYGRGLRPPEARALAPFTPVQQGISEGGAQPTEAHITQSHTLELGARLRPDPRFSAAFSTFATLLARESVFDHVSGLNLELNGTRRLGAELVGTLMPIPWLRFLFDVTFVDARFRSSEARVPFAPALTAGTRAVLAHPSGVRAGLRFQAVAPRTLPHGARGEALYLLDASAGYRFRWFDLGVVCENLLFRRLREGEYHFASYWPADATRSALPKTQVVAGPPFNMRVTLGAVF